MPENLRDLTKEELKKELGLLTKEELKEVNKQAIKEWMDEKFALVGRWSVTVIITALLGAFMSYLISQGAK